jgi:hypothetical protein
MGIWLRAFTAPSMMADVAGVAIPSLSVSGLLLHNRWMDRHPITELERGV